MISEEKLLIDLLNLMYFFTDYHPIESFETNQMVMAIDILDNPNL